jgi:signal peptidase I
VSISKLQENADTEISGNAEWREYGFLLIKLAIITLLFRSLLFSPFNIPSESMLPRLLIGDYLVVSKWAYGYSKYSFPFSPDFFDGRIFGSLPKAGDVVVFKGPKTNGVDYIKRAIGLPGDIIQMKAGRLIINGKPVKRDKLPDFVTPVTQGMRDAAAREGTYLPCWRAEFEEIAPDGGKQCRYRRYRETLPNGRSYEILDIADLQRGDDTEMFVVPEGHVFFMGDNRDRSADSRFPADGLSIGFVPVENIVGRAQVIMFSTDGSANWFLPWTWFSAARADRIGGGF